jgi:cytidine deaminase
MEPSPQQIEALVARAGRVREHAYAPYSGYRVGAALLTASGEVFEGVNVENAAYPDGICAERSAVFAAVSAGHRQFSALAVVTENAGTPCGSCRQVLAEFGLDTRVLLADPDGRIVQQTTVGELLPKAFGPSDLAPTP